MNRQDCPIALRAIAWWGIPLALLCAQPTQAQNQIVQNPGAVQLQEIWRVRGDMEGAYVGVGSGPVGDINKDGINDFAVLFGDAEEWRFYLGAPFTPSTLHSYSISNVSGSITQPVVGDFWGTGHKAIGLPRDTCNPVNSICQFRLAIFRTEAGLIPDDPAVLLKTDVQPCIKAYAIDIDRDGADELIIAYSCYTPEIWIYKGGEDFQVDTPTYIIKDGTSEIPTWSNYYTSMADIDGDGYTDLVTGGLYIDGYRLKFWYGSPTSPWSWGQPDRVVELTDASANLDAEFKLLDVDGDGIADVIRSIVDGGNRGVYLYRSGSGKDVRSRSYLYDAADRWWPGSRIYYRGGYLNDSMQRYDMTIVLGSQGLFALSGGGTGPDETYEASYRDGLGNVFNLDHPVGDVNGDGWDDYLCANRSWYQFNIGIALILAGGPQIPRPDTATSGVRVVAVAGEGLGIRMWPNPVRDRLTVTWRGDMPRPPARMEIYNSIGEQIASAALAGWHGAAEWQCGDTPAGMYVVRLLDARGTPLAVQTIVKE